MPWETCSVFQEMSCIKIFFPHSNLDAFWLCVFQKGPGDSLGDIKFSPYEAVKLYVASGDGTLSLQDLEGRAVQVISRAPDCGHELHNVW